jgi:TetR/AcrR family transcriptional regulator
MMKNSKEPSKNRSKGNRTSPETAQPRTRKRREQKRAIETRVAILEAALSEFARNGFEGASTRRIAERAGLHHPLITYHFRTKDILWRAVAERAFGEIRGMWDERIPKDSVLSPVDRVREEFRSFLQFTMEHLDFHQFMLWESRPDSPRLAWLARNMLKPTISRIVPQIKGAQKDGALPSGDPVLIYYLLIGVMSVLSSLGGEMRATSDISATSPKVVNEYWTLVDRLIFGR